MCWAAAAGEVMRGDGCARAARRREDAARARNARDGLRPRRAPRSSRKERAQPVHIVRGPPSSWHGARVDVGVGVSWCTKAKEKREKKPFEALRSPPHNLYLCFPVLGIGRKGKGYGWVYLLSQTTTRPAGRMNELDLSLHLLFWNSVFIVFEESQTE